MALIFHLTYKDAWEAAWPTGEYAAQSLASEGFIHCSKDIPQLIKVAARLYPAEAALLVLDVDLGKLKSPIKHEPSRSGEIYPHIYGKLNTDAVVRERALKVDADGGHFLEN
ncbi:MAG: DUF952 domain-containing protein [Chloroflexota bacterium]|uniref:DUF952 domain-containing protein n=1 Tax=marine metagenome TaxID=408172 RepID=A0A381P386_9ZZZZ|nr:DUF952 domain-containing protein [Chloroflexota bacterium]|tara:strand:+ start:1078 stop:1413 length:336 start_codon:yes stop_codon:yes gene_type:complete